MTPLGLESDRKIKQEQEIVSYHPCADLKTLRAYFVTSRETCGDDGGRQGGQCYREYGRLSYFKSGGQKRGGQ